MQREDMSDEETPPILIACPTVSGRISASFSLDSLLMFFNKEKSKSKGIFLFSKEAIFFALLFSISTYPEYLISASNEKRALASFFVFGETKLNKL